MNNLSMVVPYYIKNKEDFMITFEDKLPKYETDITISDLGDGWFF